MKKNALVVVYVLLPATKMQLLWKMERLIFYVMIFVMGLETVFRLALQVQFQLTSGNVRNRQKITTGPNLSKE